MTGVPALAMKILRFLLLLIFGGVFIYAGTMKAWRPMDFLEDVRSFALLPDPYAAILALFLPWVEIFGGIAVITGLGRKGGLLVLNASLVIFLAAILIAWSRGTDIRCGCFGGSGAATSNYVELIVRDVVLLVLGGYLWVSNLKASR
jgi:putative oxidoreductase